LRNTVTTFEQPAGYVEDKLLFIFLSTSRPLSFYEASLILDKCLFAAVGEMEEKKSPIFSLPFHQLRQKDIYPCTIFLIPGYSESGHCFW